MGLENTANNTVTVQNIHMSLYFIFSFGKKSFAVIVVIYCQSGIWSTVENGTPVKYAVLADKKIFALHSRGVLNAGVLFQLYSHLKTFL